MKILRRFSQQAWNPQLDVEIHTNGSVTLSGTELSIREQSLANIILRLNSHARALQKEVPPDYGVYS